MDEKRHQLAFDPLAKCRPVEGVGACEHEAVASLGVVKDQLLRNYTALRVAEHRGRVDAQMVEQARQVRCELRSRIRRRKSPAPPVAAQVGNNHAMSGCEMLDYRLVSGSGADGNTGIFSALVAQLLGDNRNSLDKAAS